MLCEGFLDTDHYRNVTVEWNTPSDIFGTFKIIHFGTWYNKPLLGKGVYTEYNGTSSTFKIITA